jgi:peptidoglycan hydrolase CwlO-like protein
MDQAVLEKHLRKTTITSNVLSIVVGLIVAMSVGFGFYYNTKSTLSQHGEDINQIKDDVNQVQTDLNEINVFKGVSSEEIDDLEEKVEKIEVKMEKMDDKLDKILLQTR